ncbi:MAG: hypothetical protein JWN02_1080 [Acidobacteria bacterium]|nr:hypothetical protein [Acidobacteriota bacterium]
MTIAVLYPRFGHPAVEERYASWQTQMLLRASSAQIHFYDPDEPASYAVAAVESEHLLAVTDPLLLPSTSLPQRLREALAQTDAVAALPVSNEGANPAQRRAADVPYMTLRELQTMTAGWERKARVLERVTWDGSDPAAFLCRTAMLDRADDPIRRVLDGQEVVISGTDYIHQWSSMRGQVRMDLLDRIDPAAKAILEFGCGEATLGEALKKRQRCRVVGVELDPHAAAVARKRIDDVYCADVREIVSLLQERFDTIIGGDIVEHLDEPWSFLSELRRLAAPGGKLLLSLPNLANGSVVGDLLRGRFDYVYMGITCVGHLRFFTRQTIEEMLSIAGWSAVSIEPQQLTVTPQAEELMAKLKAAGIDFSRDDLAASGYYVTAQNR